MRISPALLLLMLVILVFSPSIQDWATQSGTAWYRPYLLWLAVIVFVGWSVSYSNPVRGRGQDDGDRH